MNRSSSSKESLVRRISSPPTSPDQSLCFGLDDEWLVLWTSPNVAEYLAESEIDLRGRDLRQVVEFEAAEPHRHARPLSFSDQHPVWHAEGRWPWQDAPAHRWTFYRLTNQNPMGQWLVVTRPLHRSELAQPHPTSELEAAMSLAGQLAYEWSLSDNHWRWHGDSHPLVGLPSTALPQSWEQWLELIDPSDRAIAERGVAQALASHAAVQFSYRLQRGNGQLVRVSERVRYFRELNGQPNRVLGCLSLVSEEGTWRHRFEQITSDSQAAILLTDHQGAIEFANSTAEALFGYRHTELLGSSIDQLLLNAKRYLENPACASTITADASQPAPAPQEAQGIHRSQTTFPLQVQVRFIAEDTRTIVAWTLADRRGQLSDQQALADSERRLHEILDNTTAVIYMKQLDGRYVFVNRQFESLFCVTREQVVGLFDYDIFPREMADAFRVNDVRVARSGETLEIEELAPHPDGTHHYLSLKFPLRDARGQTYAVAGISTDITERVKAEHGLQQVKERLELILDSVGDGIVGVDPVGNVTFVNRAIESQLQMSEQELMGQPVEQLFQGEFPPALGEDIDLATSFIHVNRKDQSSFPAEILHRPLGQGYFRQGTVVTVRDQTDRHKREAVERELASASAVQRALYPRCSPTIANLDVAGRVYPAEQLAGDYLDFISVQDQRMTFAVGDVSGHGFGPALAMVETRAYLRGLVRSGLSCPAALSRLNQELVSDMLSDVFVTLFLGQISVATMTLTYASAGHEGLYFPRQGDPQILGSTGMLLGVSPDAEYEESSAVSLGTDDLVVVVTDGAYEVTLPDGQCLGRDSFLQLIAQHRHLSAGELADLIYRQVTQLSGQQQEDDVTILIAKVLETNQR